jgi:hypothetical protein
MLRVFDSKCAPIIRPDSSLQLRFWDETAQLLGLFQKHRESNDNANAIPCFGRLARHRFNEVASRPNFDLTKKSIISAFQPKSAGTYLHNRLLQLGYQEFWWLFSHRLCSSVCYASDEALLHYLAGGCACHTHARPDANILAALDRAGVEKIWVHLRNPAEAVVSTYHHYLGEGHGKGVFGEQRARESLMEAPRQGLAPGISKSAFVMKHIGWHLEWVADWLRFAQHRPGLVVFSYYNEIADPEQLLTRVFDELGAETPFGITSAPVPNDRYREKASTDWRHELTPEAVNYLELRLRAELQVFPAFHQLWS